MDFREIDGYKLNDWLIPILSGLQYCLVEVRTQKWTENVSMRNNCVDKNDQKVEVTEFPFLSK